MRTCPWQRRSDNNIVCCITENYIRSRCVVKFFNLLHAFDIVGNHYDNIHRISYGGDPHMEYTVLAIMNGKDAHYELRIQ